MISVFSAQNCSEFRVYHSDVHGREDATGPVVFGEDKNLGRGRPRAHWKGIILTCQCVVNQ